MDKGSNFKKIIDNNTEYAILIDGNNLPEDLKFYTDDDNFVQVASWKYNKDHETKPHSHRICERISNLTQEFIYVKKGSLEVILYNDERKVIATEVLKQGNSILILRGGHKFRILEDDTEVFEVKNGPYPGLDKDKKVIEDE